MPFYSDTAKTFGIAVEGVHNLFSPPVQDETVDDQIDCNLLSSHDPNHFFNFLLLDSAHLIHLVLPFSTANFLFLIIQGVPDHIA